MLERKEKMDGEEKVVDWCMDGRKLGGGREREREREKFMEDERESAGGGGGNPTLIFFKF